MWLILISNGPRSKNVQLHTLQSVSESKNIRLWLDSIMKLELT